MTEGSCFPSIRWGEELFFHRKGARDKNYTPTVFPPGCAKTRVFLDFPSYRAKRLRMAIPKPTRPDPNSARVPGSGTG